MKPTRRELNRHTLDQPDLGFVLTKPWPEGKKRKSSIRLLSFLKTFLKILGCSERQDKINKQISLALNLERLY